MSGNFGIGANRSSSPIDYSKRSLLAKIDQSELTQLKVSIKRSGIIATGSNISLERGIDDPAKICGYVHVRKGNPPRPPIFGSNIKVNQEFSEDRTVFTYESHSRPPRRSRSRSKSYRYRSRSKDRSHNKSRQSKSKERSRSRERSRRSRERIKRRSTSRAKRSTSRYRSRSRERTYSFDRRKHRNGSQDRYRRSRSRSLSPHSHKPDCPMYRPLDHRRRSISPLRPGEYRPGHPDLALRSTVKPRSRSRSPRSSSRGDKNAPSTSRERRSPGRSRSRRTPSPYSRDRRRSRSRHRSPPLSTPKLKYGFYDGFGPLSMHPFRGRFPIMEPGFYPRMYPPNMMMPRIPMNPMMSPMLFRPRWPVYNSGATNKMAAPKPATITSQEIEQGRVIEHINDDVANSEAVSSSDRQGDSLANDQKKN